MSVADITRPSGILPVEVDSPYVWRVIQAFANRTVPPVKLISLRHAPHQAERRSVRQRRAMVEAAR